MKKIISLVLAIALLLAMTACGGSSTPPSSPSAGGESSGQFQPSAPQKISQAEEPPVTILIAAAASLEYSLRDELIPMFQEKHKNITVEGTYDSSGKLQSQIEEGLEADLFFSAAQKQMNALKDQGLVDSDSILPLLENKIVLIVPAGKEGAITSFEELPQAGQVAIGDPASVPVGQYAQEALTNLGLWEKLGMSENADPRVSLGTNVTEVLGWVAAGSADAGIVYATDAATTDKVTVVAEAPEGSLATKVVYPIGIVSASQKKEAARLFRDFLHSDEAMAVFAKYGFAAA